MKKLIFLCLFVTSVQASDNYLNIPWGTSFEEVSKQYNLQEFENDLLKESNRLYLTWDFAKDLSLYIATDGEDLMSIDIDGRELIYLMFGFHQNKLIYTIMSTDEMKNDDKVKEKYGDLTELLRPDSCKLGYQPLFKAENPGGSIFNEGGMAAICESDRTYYECQECTGTIMYPTHLQYMFYHLDRAFFDALTGSPSYRMEDELKTIYPAYRTFTRFITKADRERSLKSDKKKK